MGPIIDIRPYSVEEQVQLLRDVSESFASQTEWHPYVVHELEMEISSHGVRYVVSSVRLHALRIALVHGAFCYPGTPVTLSLVTVDREFVRENGVIERCRCVRGRAHELVVRFNRPIDLSCFVSSATEAGGARNYDAKAVQELLDALAAQLGEGASSDRLLSIVSRLTRELRGGSS